MEKTKQQATINSIIEDRYVWTCLSPFALQLNFLEKLFPKIQGNASLCNRNNGKSPLIIIPINGHRFEGRIIPCVYRYESSDGKKNDLSVDAYFPHNPYLQHMAIMAWEKREGVSIENITDVLDEMCCETVSIMASGNQFNTFSSQMLMDDLKNQAIPINISLLMVKGWLKSLATDVVSEGYAVKEVKKQMDKKKLRCDIVNKYMTLDNILTIASRRANHISKALEKIDRDFSEVMNFIQSGDLDFYFGLYFNTRTSLTQVEVIMVLESLFDGCLKPIAKYFPANWHSEYSYALSQMEYFRNRQNKKIQNELYRNMCDQLKKKLIADINKIVR